MQLVKISLFSIYLILFSLFAVSVSAQSENDFAPGELLVKFKNGTASRAAVSVNQAIGASVKEEFPDSGWQRVKLPAGMPVNRAVAALSQLRRNCRRAAEFLLPFAGDTERSALRRDV